MNITFSGWQTLMLTSKESINCIMLPVPLILSHLCCFYCLVYIFHCCLGNLTNHLQRKDNYPIIWQNYMGHTMQKCVFSHMWTVKAQISLRINAGWSGPSLSAYRIIEYYRMYEWRGKAQMILWACAEWSKSVYFVHPGRLFDGV